MADIVRLIAAEHAQIRTLLDQVGDGVNGTSPSHAAGNLNETSTVLATLLESHLAAVEEICYIPLSAASAQADRAIQQASADGDDLRDALGEATLHQPGSRLWRLAAAGARAAALRHVSRVETALAEYACRAPAPERDKLYRQWIAFSVAREPGYARC